VKTITVEGVQPVDVDDVKSAFEAIVGRTQESPRQRSGSQAREAEEEA
jgi:hypothetical protein